MTNDWVDVLDDIKEEHDIECDGCGKGFPLDSLYDTMYGCCCLDCFEDYLYNFNEEDFNEK